MNILIWNHSEDGQLFENVVGYISIPLMNLISPGIGKKRRIFYLCPPGPSRFVEMLSSIEINRKISTINLSFKI